MLGFVYGRWEHYHLEASGFTADYLWPLLYYTIWESWYKSIIYLDDKLKIDLEKIKNFNRDKLKFNLKDCLKKYFIICWREERTLGLNEGRQTTFYKIKETFSREFYLNSFCLKQRNILTKFWLSAHFLRIETGRYKKKCRDEGGNVKQLDREQRKCLFCNLNKVEDELHFLLECPLYIKERCLFVNETQILWSNFQ